MSASKHNLIGELFVRTADENYITSRWCAANGLKTDFLWLAVHALEKYLKAVLLSNGLSAKGYGHDIIRLYAEVKSFAGDLLPNLLSRPATLDIYHWSDRTPEEFVEHLHRNGNADNRYLIYGYATGSQDLHMLDQMVFATRRLICPLDERVIKREGGPTFTHREVLARQPEYYSNNFKPLDSIIASQDDSELRSAALNLNMAFAPSDYEHNPAPGGYSAVNPVIMRRILDPLNSKNRDCAAEGIEVAEWLLANMQIPKGRPSDPSVAEQIQEAIEQARRKHCL